MILYELYEGYDKDKGEYSSRRFFLSVDEIWDYLNRQKEKYHYHNKERELRYKDIDNATKDFRHTRTLISDNGNRYALTPYKMKD